VHYHSKTKENIHLNQTQHFARNVWTCIYCITVVFHQNCLPRCMRGLAEANSK